jgi:hypothetical protein
MSIDNLLKEFKPNKGQMKFIALWLSKKFPIVAMCGGWGVGKTRLVAMLCHLSHEDDPGIAGFYVTDSMGRGARTIAIEMAALLEPLGWTYNHAFKGQPAPHWKSPKKHGKQTIVWALSWKRPSGKSMAANSLEGPDCGWGILDEAQVVDSEVGSAMLGRVRSGAPGRLCLLGKPCYDPWQIRFSESRGGTGFFCPSTVNRENLPNFDDWITALSRREVLENIYCIPQAPQGAVFDMWSPEEYPKGNVMSPAWRPEPWMRTMITMDFGVRSPSALVISHDPRIGKDGADVIWAEANPDRASVFDLCAMLRKGVPSFGIPGIWPAYREHDLPAGSIPCHAAYGDRAGRNMRDDQNMTSAITDVQLAPAAGGLGLRVAYTDQPGRIDINAGIRLLWRLMETNAGDRRLLCSSQLWNYGTQSGGRSFAKSITNYRWQTGSKDIPKKDGVHDHACDALRYWAINARWAGSESARHAAAAFRSDPASQRRISRPGDSR